MSDRHQEIPAGHITTVQLSAQPAKQRAFLKRLAIELGDAGTIGALTPGPSADVFVIPQPLEEALRARPALQPAAAWEAQLRAWGALTVNQLARDAFFHVQQVGTVVVDGRPLGVAKLIAPEPAPPAKTASQGPRLPDPFQGSYDWNLDERGANVVNAWKRFAGEARFAAALPWAEVRVGHLDTGYTEHAALGWAGGSSVTVHPRDGRDYYDPHDPDPRDDWLPGFPGHGTRISAAIAGFMPQAPGHGFFGVAPGVGIVPYRVTDSVIIDHVRAEVGAAIREAVADGCHVINISLGALFGSKHLSDALDFAYERGVITVCAAGQVWGEVIYPGRYNRCVTMGGVGPQGRPWRSAAKGQYVDLCGPAVKIRRVKAEPLPAGQAAQSVLPDADGDGTSYATATCSGVAALWLAWHGIAKLRAHYGSSGLWQIPQAFKNLVRACARPGNWPASENGNYGSGIIDAAALLALPLPADGSFPKSAPAAAPFDPVN